jgi:hemerythrin-like domain-containing protein
MMPIGPLMIEHRLIERMVKWMADQLPRIEDHKEMKVESLSEAIDFIRTYADRCHHGKEEDILFRDLGRKPLAPEHKKIMDELIEEHIAARKMVRRLTGAKERYARGEKEGLPEITACLGELVKFYPSHIKKEDQHFFIPAMGYFTPKEKDDMLQDFWTFDRNLIHEKYKQMLEKFEAQ